MNNIPHFSWDLWKAGTEPAWKWRWSFLDLASWACWTSLQCPPTLGRPWFLRRRGGKGVIATTVKKNLVSHLPYRYAYLGLPRRLTARLPTKRRRAGSTTLKLTWQTARAWLTCRGPALGFAGLPRPSTGVWRFLWTWPLVSGWMQGEGWKCHIEVVVITRRWVIRCARFQRVVTSVNRGALNLSKFFLNLSKLWGVLNLSKYCLNFFWHV